MKEKEKLGKIHTFIYAKGSCVYEENMKVPALLSCHTQKEGDEKNLIKN